MAKDLPYFNFYPAEWITGDITICSMSAQGLFVNLLAFYWNRECSICLAFARQKFSNNIAELEQLLELGIIKTDPEGNIIIEFLDEQMEKFIDISEKRSKSGRKGGINKAKNADQKSLANAKQMSSKESRVENSRVENIIDYCISEWNDIAKDRPHMKSKRKVGTALLKKMKTRIKEHPEIDEWKELFSEIRNSKFLGIHSESGWFTFDCIFTVQKRFDDIMNRWMEWRAIGNNQSTRTQHTDPNCAYHEEGFELR